MNCTRADPLVRGSKTTDCNSSEKTGWGTGACCYKVMITHLPANDHDDTELGK